MCSFIVPEHYLVVIVSDERYNSRCSSLWCLQIVVPFLITVVLLKSNLIVTYIIAFASGVSIAAAFLLPWWVSVRNKGTTVSEQDCFPELICVYVHMQVHASWCGRWLQSAESWISGARSHLLLLLRVLHKVCLRSFSGNFNSKPRVSTVVLPEQFLLRFSACISLQTEVLQGE